MVHVSETTEASDAEEPSQARLLNEGSVIAQVALLAWPVFVEQMLQVLVGFSDTVLTGRFLSEEHLAAVMVADYIMWFFRGGVFMLVSAGSTALVARFVGAKESRDARFATNQSLIVGMALALVAMTLGIVLAPQLVAAVQLEGAAAGYAVHYLRWVLPVMPLIMIEVVGIACLRGAGDTISGMWVMGSVNLINVAVSWSLVHGVGPLPELGWTGIAVGTAIAHCFGGLAIAALLLRGRAGLRVRGSMLAPERTMIRRLLRIGAPAGGDVMTIILCHFTFLGIINSLGTASSAAHGVALRTESLAFLSATAFAVSATTLTGQHLGAGRPRRAAQAALTAFGMGALLMVSLGVVFWMFPEQLVGLFVREDIEQVVELGAPLLRLVAWAMPFLAVTMILTGALRGAGDTRWPWAFTLIGYIGIRLPTAYVLAHVVGLGVYGAWMASVVDVVIRSGMVLGRFLHGGWKKVQV